MPEEPLSTLRSGNHLTIFRDRFRLALISLLILFLELACIRWFPAHVLFLTFFTNTMLLACFLGMSAGCLAASSSRNYSVWTPPLLAVSMGAALGVEFLRSVLYRMVAVGSRSSPQLVFFGTEHTSTNPSRFVIPMVVVEGFFFLMVALALVGPGQELGRALRRVPNRVEAYSLNIFGSLLGIVIFAAFSWLELSPFWWFLLVVIVMGYFLWPKERRGISWTWRDGLIALGVVSALGVVLVLASSTPFRFPWGDAPGVKTFWSPYYRIDYYSNSRSMDVNLVFHQQMVSRQSPSPAYAYSLPYLLNRDSGGRRFDDVLVIGAGTGNDVSRALAWGARRVDAVEIDPVILRLGKKYHPDAPYHDPRVHLHLGDGRNFLRSTSRHYDLVIFGLVDSLVMHSSYSNIRLESFLFTDQAFADVQAHLKPGGWFVAYNYFRQGWIVCRMYKALTETFGSEPLVLTLPAKPIVNPRTSGGFTMIISDPSRRLRMAFRAHPDYWLAAGKPAGPNAPDGFYEDPPAGEHVHWEQFRDAKVQNFRSMKDATDDWPFLYLNHPMVTRLGWEGIATMGGLAVLMLALFSPRKIEERKGTGLGPRMFFLGAGFMLVETRAVVYMALLFGTTWIVNTIVFFAVLVMILFANLYVLKFRPRDLRGYYAGLVASLGLNVLIPMNSFLGMNRGLQVFGSCLLVFTPILFAGVIFAVAFNKSARPDQDFGVNVAGAMFGGLAEYSSMLVGFRLLGLIALLFYILSAVLHPSAERFQSPAVRSELS